MRTVLRIVDETDAGEVVIDGVAHVPGDRLRAVAEVDVLSVLADTLDVLVEIAERLQQRGERVHLMPFGWRKACRAEAVTGPGARRIIQLSADGNVSADPGFRGIHPLAGWRLRDRWVSGSC
ncbi:hypothetical protein [Nocardia sp. NPDC057455]|uniref:hypothetical protein n=1 Tax=Nocardia sp. NPDC057455 TaxID=3346138 RepID=UPI0036700551